MRKNGSTLVSTVTTKRACIEVHQSDLNKYTKNGEAKITGKASLNSVGINGKFNNKFHDAIITKVVFAIDIWEGSTLNTYYADHILWLEPNQHDAFSAKYRDNINVTVPENGCPKDSPEIDCWVWYISEVWGVKIK